jgi:integral membrane protein
MWKGLAGAELRFRIIAYIVGVVLGLLTIWLIVGYGFLDYANVANKPPLYGALWTMHGWAYFAYLIFGVDLCFRMRYGVWRTLAILLAGTIPFMSFVAERITRQDVQARLFAEG